MHEDIDAVLRWWYDAEHDEDDVGDGKHTNT